MNNNNSTGISYTAAFFILIGLAILGVVAASIAGAAILGGSAGFSPEAITRATKDPANAGTLRLIQGISVVLGFLVPTLLTARMVNRRPMTLLGVNREINMKQVGMVLAIAITSLFVAGALGWLNKALPISEALKASFDKAEKDYGDQVQIMMDLKTVGGYLSSLFLIAFLPALCEEMLFRAGLQNFLTRGTKNPVLAILVVSVLFSIVHFSFYGFLPRLYLGVILGTIYYLTGSVWLPVLGHFLNNGLAVTQAFIMSRQGKSMDEIMKSDVPGGALYWGFLVLPLVILLVRTLKKNTPPPATETEVLNQFPEPSHGI